MEVNKNKIPHYINDPVINKLTAPENKLYRPYINYRQAVAWVFGVIIVSFIASLIITCLYGNSINNEFNWRNILITFIYCNLVISTFFLRFILVWLIRLYQKYALSETRLKCCYEPSCSEYTILALKKYGVIIGGIKSVKRLMRCGPPGGIDYP